MNGVRVKVVRITDGEKNAKLSQTISNLNAFKTESFYTWLLRPTEENRRYTLTLVPFLFHSYGHCIF